MTRKEIEKAVAFWQPILKLTDWTIEVVTKPAKDLYYKGSDNDGLNWIHPERMYSEIWLRRGAKEDDLIHEILHLVLDGDAELQAYDVLHERKINRLAEALMMLKDRSTNAKR